MNHAIANAIRSFVAIDPLPALADLMNRDAPTFEWTTALVEALVGQPLVAYTDQSTGATQMVSQDGTLVLRITASSSGAHIAEGLMAQDLSALLYAIRIHEVDSHDLILLPPEMRKADLVRLCKRAGLTIDRLRRFTDIWISQQ